MAFVYSCCFWFSLRLGGIFIGLFSFVQALIALIIFCIASKQYQNIKQQISSWMKNIDLIYISGFMENFLADPEKYITYCIAFTCVYIFVCILYIHGAYVCNNIMMLPFILVELIRLVILSIVVTLLLLILKQNTMDIGLVIGASVVGGFGLLGMFYLWVCAANLPILINEMEREEQEATIKKLQRLLKNKRTRFKPGFENMSIDNDNADLYRSELFILPGNMLSKGVQNNVISNNSYHPSSFLP